MTAPIWPAEDPQALERAAELLRRGGLVAFPTETVYGLGADAFNREAVARIFAAKQRPSFDPLIVHLADPAEVVALVRKTVADLPKLAALFWPGPLTLVVAKQPCVPDIVTAGLDTVALRVPAHPAARALVQAAGTPLAAPSANPFGYVSPTTAAHVAAQLGDKVDAILDGGPCHVGVESTILSLASEPPRLLRPGGVSRDSIEEVLGRPIESAPSETARPIAPGQLARHYATRTPLVVLPGSAPAHPRDLFPASETIGLLALFEAPARGRYQAIEVLAKDGRLTTAAANLFAALRRLDGQGLDVILAEPCPAEGIGHAILDRLRRCATGRGADR